METPLTCKKDAISYCRIKQQRQTKSKMEFLRKLFERYFDRGVLVYLKHQSMPCLITRYCMGCTIQDPRQRHHYCITRMEECNFSEMLNIVDLYMVYELTNPI